MPKTDNLFKMVYAAIRDDLNSVILTTFGLLVLISIIIIFFNCLFDRIFKKHKYIGYVAIVVICLSVILYCKFKIHVLKEWSINNGLTSLGIMITAIPILIIFIFKIKRDQKKLFSLLIIVALVGIIIIVVSYFLKLRNIGNSNFWGNKGSVIINNDDKTDKREYDYSSTIEIIVCGRQFMLNGDIINDFEQLKIELNSVQDTNKVYLYDKFAVLKYYDDVKEWLNEKEIIPIEGTRYE